MHNTAWLVGLVLLFSFNAFSQQIRIAGEVENILREPVNNASVLLIDSVTQTPLAFSLTENGKFQINLLDRPQSGAYLQVNAFGYHPEFAPVDWNHPVYVIHLTKDTTINLKEVVVLARAKGYEVKEDTIAFSVDAYKQQGDEKVQDVIQRLPGFDVNPSTGEIKFRGKTIETILIDGDNLLDANYTIASRNINLDVVEEIQAIEDFNNNPVLRGIQSSNNVAVNLKLKNNRTDYSGSLDVGLGASDDKIARDVRTNILAINKVSKSLAVASSNNVGENRGIFDYFNFMSGNSGDDSFKAPRYINHTTFPGELEERRLNRNNQHFGNVNSILKIQKNLSVKANGFITRDRFETATFQNRTNRVEGDIFSTTDELVIDRSPSQQRFESELNYHLRQQYQFSYKFKYHNESVRDNLESTLNGNATFANVLKTNETFTSHEFIQSLRLDSSSALLMSVLHAVDLSKQGLTIAPYQSPGAPIVDQVLKPREASDVFSLSFLKSYGSIKSLISLSHKRRESTLDVSRIIGAAEKENSAVYTMYLTSFKHNLHFKTSRWDNSLSLLLNRLNQRMLFHEERSAKQLFLTPQLNVRFKFNRKGYINANAKYDRETMVGEHLLSDTIAIDARMTMRDTLQLALAKSRSLSFGMFQENLERDVSVAVTLNYQSIQGNYLSRYFVDEASSFIQRYWSPTELEQYTLSGRLSKFLPSMNLNVKLTTVNSIMAYQNFVNDSDSRNNRVIRSKFTLFVKTAFDGILNVENTVALLRSSSTSGDVAQFVNLRYANTFKTILSGRTNWFFLGAWNTIWPSSTSSAIHLADFTLRYRPTNKKYSISVLLRNISSTKAYRVNHVTDFYSAENSILLVKPFGLLELQCQL